MTHDRTASERTGYLPSVLFLVPSRSLSQQSGVHGLARPPPQGLSAIPSYSRPIMPTVCL